LVAEAARQELRAPVNVTWEITSRCNLSCSHCLSDAGAASPGELSREECRQIVDQLAALKVFQINIGGGEPFIRDDFPDFLNYAHEKGVVICVSTNGTFMDDGLARWLSTLDMLYLQVSLDGASAEVNDRIRGEGTYMVVLQALAALARHGVPFSINTVLTRLNFSQLDALREIAKEYGAELRVSRFRPSGRGKASRDSLSPDKDQLEDFADWLAAHDLVRTGDSFFCLVSEARRKKGLDMCGAAKMTCCLSPTGEVYPCAFLQERPFLAGRIREQTLKDIWDHAPIMKQLRNLRVTSCETCARFEHCRGGCPAVAYHSYRDIHTPDPECLMNVRSGEGRILARGRETVPERMI
jgi:mycofactocin biosynthetic radical S-adenosylmethionine protein MftC